MFSSLFWRLWKWLLHLLTGRCELYRLALWSVPVHQRTWHIRLSLLQSRTKALGGVVRSSAMDVSEAVRLITTVKQIPQNDQEQFKTSIEPCVLRIRSVKALLDQLEELRAQVFSKESSQDEAKLMELWSMLYPSVELEARITKQWQDIGFQGNDPVTDLRGMGMLGLECLHYFSASHTDRARSVLSHSHHPKYGYPYAIVVINLTSLAYGWLKDGSLDQYLYRTCQQWPLHTAVFTGIVCCLVVRFDQYWMDCEPENVMVFPKIRDMFAGDLAAQLDNDSLELTVK